MFMTVIKCHLVHFFHFLCKVDIDEDVFIMTT